MQVSKFIQAVILMIIVALAASCIPGKEYAQKIFPTQPEENLDSVHRTVQFLQWESEGDEKTFLEQKDNPFSTTSDAAGNANTTTGAVLPKPVQRETENINNHPADSTVQHVSTTPDSRGVRQKRSRNQ